MTQRRTFSQTQVSSGWMAFAAIALWILFAYAGAAFMVFQYRNPLANQMSFYRDFGSVMTLEKLDKYQHR